jgi:Acetyltransferase (GNAT) domain
MMALALARCFDDRSVLAVLVDPLASNTRSHRFYERIGFRFLESRRFGADECFVYRLAVPTTCKPRTGCNRSAVKANLSCSIPHENHLEEKP